MIWKRNRYRGKDIECRPQAWGPRVCLRNTQWRDTYSEGSLDSSIPSLLILLLQLLLLPILLLLSDCYFA